MTDDPCHNDLGRAWTCRDHIKRWSAECENASARLELARIEERLWLVLSQHEPVGSLGIDREKLRIVLDYIRTGKIADGYTKP